MLIGLGFFHVLLRRGLPRAALLAPLILCFIGLAPAYGQIPTPTPAMETDCGSATDCLDRALDRMAAGETGSALDVLRSLQSRYPDSVAASRATFLIGLCYKRLNDPRTEESLEQSLVDAPELGDYALSALGDWAFDRQDFPAAAKEYRALVMTFPESLLVSRALYRMASAYLKGEQWSRAMEAADRFEARYPGDSKISEIKRIQGESWIGLGKLDRAVTVFRRLWVDDPNSAAGRYAEGALDRLKARKVRVPPPTVVERLERAQNLFAAGATREAAAMWEALLAHGAPKEKRLSLRLKIGVARVKLRDDDGATSVLIPLASGRQPVPIRTGALGQLAALYYRRGDAEGLTRAATELSSLSPGDPETARALFLLGNLFEERGKLMEAALAFRSAIDQAPAGALADESLWHKGWCFYLGGNYENAARVFASFPGAYPKSPMVPQVLYWEGRSLEAAGKKAEAEERYQSVCGQYRLTYYCQRVAERIRVPPQDQSGPPASADPGKRAPYEEDFHYRRAAALRLIRMTREAAAEMDATLSRFSADPVVLAELNTMLYEVGDYRRALRNIKIRYADVLNQGDPLRRLSFWVQAYPRGWMDHIQRVLPPGGATPDLVAALIREESAYDPQAVSSVGAMGLMQLMPETGQWVAKQSGQPALGKSSLFDPETNIRLGSWYLSHLLERYSGSVVRAVAAYNAGTTIVDRWIEEFGSRDPEAFTESIPYRETRNFVKRVLRSAGEYRRIGALLADAPSS